VVKHDETYGELREGLHIAGYTFERVCIRLKTLLAGDGWKQCGGGFKDVNKFLDSLRFERFKAVAEERKEIAALIKRNQPKASNRQIAKTLGVNRMTINRDIGTNVPPEDKSTSNINDRENLGGTNVPSLSGAAAAVAVHKTEQRAAANEKILTSRNNYEARDKEAVIGDLKAMAEAEQKFSVIYADPPWEFKVYSGKGKSRSAERHYDCSSLEAIKALPVKDLAAPDAALFLWAVWPELTGALEVIKAWGFEYKTIGLLWVKSSPNAEQIGLDGAGLHWGMGYWTRANTEPCLFATRGNPQRLDKGVHQVIIAPVGEHSAKPPDARRQITRLIVGPYLELFARQAADGWTSWGDEL
jgi:N6-adenosine-specific RNA methylase IME4